MADAISRRSFIQLTGFTALSAATLLTLPHSFAIDTNTPQYARVLRPVRSPDGKDRLPQDAVVALTATGETGNKWLRKADIQPMPGYDPLFHAPMPASFPSVVEVCAPSTLICTRCDVASAVMGKVGYGSAAWALDMLPGTQAGMSDWLAIADGSGALIGWSQAEHWRHVADEMTPIRGAEIVIDSREQTLTLVQNSTKMGSWPITTTPNQPQTRTGVVSRSISTRNAYAPLSWSLALSDGRLFGGADWHNEFGRGRPTPHIEAHPSVAKWLYHHVPDGAAIDFV